MPIIISMHCHWFTLCMLLVTRPTTICARDLSDNGNLTKKKSFRSRRIIINYSKNDNNNNERQCNADIKVKSPDVFVVYSVRLCRLFCLPFSPFLFNLFLALKNIISSLQKMFINSLTSKLLSLSTKQKPIFVFQI